MCACYKWQILVSISMQQSAFKTCLCERRPDYRPNEWKLHSLTLLFYRSLCGLWLRYKLNRRAIHSNYSDSQCFRTPKWLNCQHNLRIIAFSWTSAMFEGRMLWRTKLGWWPDSNFNLSMCVMWVNPRVSPSVCIQLSEWWREGWVLSWPLSCFVQCSASPT